MIQISSIKWALDVYFTNDFWILIEIWWKLQFVVIQSPAIQLLETFADIKTFMATTSSEYEWNQIES